VSFSWTFFDLTIFVIFYLFFISMSSYFYQYFYFFSIGLIFFIISLIGWIGFTLSFIILLILYSTLVVVFWSFFIAFEDQKKKNEKLKNHLFFVFAFCFLLSSKSVGLYTPTFLKHLYSFDYFMLFEESEFFYFFVLVYSFNSITTLFIFFVLVFTCFNIVSTLIIKQKLSFSTSFVFYSVFSNGRMGSAFTNSSRSSFWSTFSTNLGLIKLGKNF